MTCAPDTDTIMHIANTLDSWQCSGGKLVPGCPGLLGHRTETWYLSIAVMNGNCDKVQFGLVLYLFSGVTDVQGLAGRLLEVALLRIAKVIICHKSSLKMGRITMGFLTARHLKFKSIRPLFSLSLSGPVRTRAGWHHFQPPWCRTLRRGERRQLWWLR